MRDSPLSATVSVDLSLKKRCSGLTYTKESEAGTYITKRVGVDRCAKRSQRWSGIVKAKATVTAKQRLSTLD
ncbi:hypothetical protein WJX77_012661 [Trebouxia sp. C0004]